MFRSSVRSQILLPVVMLTAHPLAMTLNTNRKTIPLNREPLRQGECTLICRDVSRIFFKILIRFVKPLLS